MIYFINAVNCINEKIVLKPIGFASHTILYLIYHIPSWI
jgi:hypothetical protein